MRVIGSALAVAVVLSAGASALQQSDAEQAVLARVEAHWEARSSNDIEAQAEMMSESGVYNANSNGAFFTFTDEIDLEAMQRNLSGEFAIQVYYPEAVQIAEDVVLARYYLEGYINNEGGRVPDYRTRVTHIWVREDDAWKTKSWHFSPLHDGGHHQPSAADYEE